MRKLVTATAVILFRGVSSLMFLFFEIETNPNAIVVTLLFPSTIVVLLLTSILLYPCLFSRGNFFSPKVVRCAAAKGRPFF